MKDRNTHFAVTSPSNNPPWKVFIHSQKENEQNGLKGNVVCVRPRPKAEREIILLRLKRVWRAGGESAKSVIAEVCAVAVPGIVTIVSLLAYAVYKAIAKQTRQTEVHS